jgi:hypothetical protein
LRGISPSHNLKGINWIADFHILVGIIWILMSVMILFSGNASIILLIGNGIILVSYGIFLIIAGFYLDILNRWAWAVIIISNLVVCALIIHSVLSDLGTELIITSSTLVDIINIAIGIIIVVYLLTPRVRSHFRIGKEERASVID